MLNWKEISNNPFCGHVRSSVRHELLTRRKTTANYMALLERFVRAKRVLDLGIVEHDISQSTSLGWKHRYVREWADYVLGIDILSAAIETLRKQGYNVKTVDATSDEDMGDRFDRVVIGDVIEHVNNPVRLLKFAARHLSPDGLILVATPNPYFVRYIWQTLVRGTFVGSADHVAWISPSEALELGRRAGLCLHEYWLLQRGRRYPQTLVWDLFRYILPKSELLAEKFVYIYGGSTGEGRSSRSFT